MCGEKGRWKQNLIAKCLREGKPHDDASVSPVVRQTLLHWAYEISEADFASGAKRVKTHGAAYVPTDSLGGVLTGTKRKKAFHDDDDDDGATQESKRASTEAAGKERELRAQRRAEAESVKKEEGEEEAASAARPAKRARDAVKPSTTTKAARSARSSVAAKDPAYTEYEKQRDAQRAQNESKLRELGLA